ncbi:hypothetical protein DFQ01_10149 [Paenibacillus cellulosilyticus]|uniref:Methyltransferase family protein n=1 Tax=Paenibacillus cellulosilyticus TaxID=375489 RepID=A0A2V2YZB8_9BACL|nr:hypothetical protein [Paenibacillus cellulosilyticus]PWW08328.1 hypothetical protein DFQ01_10149 [Paenibacillus cellulosilyticus]QKS47927.1 hypothetical protein HUB94_26895 [Paenibacillus cellulosilyticus]
MLKAYDYIEFNNNNVPIHNELHLNNEKGIAEQFVRNHQVNEHDEIKECPICNHDKSIVFSKVWEIPYYRCESCWSIFNFISAAVVTAYKQNQDLIDYRLSESYQSDASLRRDTSWEELLDWIKFRTYRYLERNRDLDVIDYGNRYYALIDKIKGSNICKQYELRNSIAMNYSNPNNPIGQADVILYLNNIQQSVDPVRDLIEVGQSLKQEGLLFLSTRVSTGFDILTLQQNINNIYPFEHNLLLSKSGIEIVLKNAGYRVLEISTPGLMDLQYVQSNLEGIHKDNLFVKYLLEHGDQNTLSEFQRFIQKSGMSSFAQVVAQREVT